MKKTTSLPLRITTWLLTFLLTMGSCNKPANGIDPMEEVEEITSHLADTTQAKPTKKENTPPPTPEEPKPQTPEKPKDNPTQPQTPPAQPQTPPAQPKPQTPEKPKDNPAQPQTPPAQPQTPPAQPKPQTPEKPKDNPTQPQTPSAQPQTPPAQPKPQTPEKPKDNPAQPQTPPAGGGHVLVPETVNLVLTADKQKIKADGQDMAVLRLTNNGRELTEGIEYKVRKTGGSINGHRFTATRAGIYEIQATYQGRHLSNSIRIQAVATALTMIASQTRIVADGRQSVQFSVREGNQDVSLRSTIMMQYEGEEVMVVGGRFTPRQPGVYRFVARYRGLSSNTVEVTVVSPSSSLPADSHTPIGKLTTKWVKGVNQHSGWYDVNKKNDGRGADGLRCWAASTACMLQWWQDNYRKAGYQLPPTAIDGPGTTYELKIFEHFMDCWTNEGASAFVGCRWYMTGEDAGAKYSNFARLIKHGQGGKLSSVHQAIAHQLGSDYATTVGGYSTWGAASTSREPSLAIFSRLILKALDEGIVSLDINPGYSGSHAITLWGVEYDERGIIHKMYVTDSDDLIRTPRAPRKPILHAYYLENSPREPRVIGLRGASYKNFVELLNFDTLRGYPGS